MCLLVVLLVVAAWLIGRGQGSKAALEIASERVVNQLEIDALQRLKESRADIADMQDQVLVAQRQVEAADNTAAALQEALNASLQQSSEDAAELDLYRRIASSDLARGLGIDSVQWRGDPLRKLTVTLVQWRGRNSVEGQVQVALILKQRTDNENSAAATNDDSTSADGPSSDAFTEIEALDKILLSPEQPSNSLSSAETTAASDTLATELITQTVSLPTQRFDFRFFEKIDFSTASLNLQNNSADLYDSMQPVAVDIRVVPDSRGVRGTVVRIPWSEVDQ